MKAFTSLSLDRSLTKAELARVIRQDIIGENEAIITYEAHVRATDDPSTITILSYIIDDEKEHSAMLQALLERLNNDQALLTVKAETMRRACVPDAE